MNEIKKLSLFGLIAVIFYFLHVMVTVLVVVFTLIALILFIIGFFKAKNINYLGTIFLFAFIIGWRYINKYTSKRILWNCRTNKCIYSCNLYRDFIALDE